MKTITDFVILSLSCLCMTTAHAVTFDFAQIGNAGNAGELSGSSANDLDAIVGAVAYNYAISKTEVTNAQYTEFLNGVDPTGANTLALYNANMAGNLGGIENTGATDGARYIAQVGREQNPVTWVSWFDSVRFINWLHNGQGAGDTETGAYTLLGGKPTPSNGISITRSSSAIYWLPSENEWYKAAYHDVSAGTAGTYFDYATGSNSIPVSAQPGDDPAAVNYFNDDGIANGFNDGFAISGTTVIGVNPFTDVRAYAAAESPYGTFDQSGNVREWNETLIDPFLGGSRGLRGGSWDDASHELSASLRGIAPVVFDLGVGFRVATVPEPSSLLGDYNENGFVDAADYTVWKDSFGSTVNLAADGDDSGEIDGGDYAVWVNHFGESSALSASIPEPTSLLLLVSLAGSLLLKRRR